MICIQYVECNQNLFMTWWNILIENNIAVSSSELCYAHINFMNIVSYSILYVRFHAVQDKVRITQKFCKKPHNIAVFVQYLHKFNKHQIMSEFNQMKKKLWNSVHQFLNYTCYQGSKLAVVSRILQLNISF